MLGHNRHSRFRIMCIERWYKIFAINSMSPCRTTFAIINCRNVWLYPIERCSLTALKNLTTIFTGYCRQVWGKRNPFTFYYGTQANDTKALNHLGGPWAKAGNGREKDDLLLMSSWKLGSMSCSLLKYDVTEYDFSQFANHMLLTPTTRVYWPRVVLDLYTKINV